jgi:hypothetical protein
MLATGSPLVSGVADVRRTSGSPALRRRLSIGLRLPGRTLPRAHDADHQHQARQGEHGQHPRAEYRPIMTTRLPLDALRHTYEGIARSVAYPHDGIPSNGLSPREPIATALRSGTAFDLLLDLRRHPDRRHPVIDGGASEN